MATAKKTKEGTWRVLAYIGKKPDGSRQYKSFTAATKKAAELMAAKYLADQDRDVAENITLQEAMDRYVESKKNVLSPVSVVDYNRIKANYLPDLRRMKLSKITQEDIQIAINQEAKDKSAKTVRDAHGFLSAVLKAYRPNMRLATTLPKKEKNNLYIPDNEDIKVLLSNITDKNLKIAVMLAAFGSLRRSEICALTSDDVKDGYIEVNKAMVRDEHGNWIIKAPKSFAGNRAVTLPDFVMELFSGVKGKIIPWNPNQVTDHFRRHLRASGVSKTYRFHDLRHYQASILHAMGVPDKYIMERGGWQTDSTLKNIYQHTLKNKSDETAKKINSYFTSEFDTE